MTEAEGAGARCPACAAELPAAFPGASVACGCGHRVQVAGPPLSNASSRPSARNASPPPGEGGGPYRAVGAAPEAAIAAVPCPYCGNECPPMVRIIAFASSGGLERTREREKADRREERQRASEAQAQLAVTEAPLPLRRSRAEDWDELLHAIFRW